MKLPFTYSREELSILMEKEGVKIKSSVQLCIPPWHPFAVCLLAVQQASPRPQAAIK